jgi:RNA polymerase sigma factor (sigma-70 family)
MMAGTDTEQPRGRLADAAADDFRAWRAGDGVALDRLVRRLTPTLWHVARAYGLSREAAEDAVQSSWVVFSRSSDSVRDPQAVLAWLCVVARRQALQMLQESRNEDSTEPGTLSEVAPAQAGLEDGVLADREARILWQKVNLLPDRCRRLLRIVAFDDRPDYQAVSTRLGMPVGSIGPTRRRCLDKLRALLADDPEWSGR